MPRTQDEAAATAKDTAMEATDRRAPTPATQDAKKPAQKASAGPDLVAMATETKAMLVRFEKLNAPFVAQSDLFRRLAISIRALAAGAGAE